MYMMMLGILSFSAPVLPSQAQIIYSTAEISNFQKRNYRAGTQNWDILQDSSGRMYFANNEGVLIYNGINWQLEALPNNTVVRSLAWGPDNLLYAGGQDEFGYFNINVQGRPEYTSLTRLLPTTLRKFADVWQIVVSGNSIFFLTNMAIFQYNGDKITIFNPASSWLSMFLHQGKPIAHDEQRGLLSFNSGTWQLLVDKKDLPPGFFMTGMESMGLDTTLLASSDHGLFFLIGNALVPIGPEKEIARFKKLSSLASVDNLNYAAGTYQQGVVIFDRSGNIKNRVDQNNGLQNNSIRCLFADRQHHIWLGLENGIDLIHFGSAISVINPAVFNQGAGYSSAIFKGKAFYALSSGVFESNLPTGLASNKNASFKNLLVGQTWNLTAINGQLLIGRENDIFSYDGNKLEQRTAGMGYWNFLPIGDTLVYSGNYTGVQKFNTSGNRFQDAGYLTTEPGSSRFMFNDKQSLWVSHPYRGIFRINKSDGVSRIYDTQKGLPSAQENYVFLIKGQVLAATEKGLYRYNESNDRFEQDPEYAEYFKDISLRYLREDLSGNIWFVHNKSLGVLDLSAKKPGIIYISELNNRILSGFENINPVNSDTLLIGGEYGFFQLDFSRYRRLINRPGILIHRVSVAGNADSIIYGGYNTNMRSMEPLLKEAGKRIAYGDNNISIAFASADAMYMQDVEFAYKLEGLDENWSHWSAKTEANYIGLPPGDYTFRVKARSGMNNESATAAFSFTIAPPWYKSMMAIVIYFLSGLFLIYFFFKQQEQRHKRQHDKKLQAARERYEAEQLEAANRHQIEIEKAEKELIRLRNENLEKEIKFKEEELASAAMNLVQKKEFILKVREQLQHAVNMPADTTQAEDLKKILRSMQSEDRLNKEWDQFSQHFNNVHAGFMDVLVRKYPELKPHELKLCAYLRMNLSSKEIANLLSISVRGVEISRYRLRKKLKLPTETNLFQFLYDVNRQT